MKTRKKKSHRNRRANPWRLFALIICTLLAIVLVLEHFEFVKTLITEMIELFWSSKREFVEILAALLVAKDRLGK